MDPPRRPPGSFMAYTPTTPTGPTFPSFHQRSPSADSSDSGFSMTSNNPSQQQQQGKRPTIYPPPRALAVAGGSLNSPSAASSPSSSTTSLHNFSRPSIAQIVGDGTPARKNSPLNPAVAAIGVGNDPRSHKRNNSQGFFEPTLPTASLASPDHGVGPNASQIAAQAAMMQQAQQQQMQQQQQQAQLQISRGGVGGGGMDKHMRKRSQTVPSPQDGMDRGGGRMRPPPPLPVGQAERSRKGSGGSASGGLPMPQYPQSASTSPTIAAATAAASQAAQHPRGAQQLSPGLTSFAQPDVEGRDGSGASGREGRREKAGTKMKLFSRPKNIKTGEKEPRDREKEKPLPSPGKAPSIYSRGMNASMTSLSESIAPPPSIYSIANSSTSTLVPERQKEEKDKSHRHNFLTRQKHKFKEDHTLTLSSASSNSKPMDPSAPSSIYNFAPSSPGASQGTFAKSVSGLDLRHGGRALREKKREEKAAAAAAANTFVEPRQRLEAESAFGPPIASMSTNNTPLDFNYGPLQGFGLNNMSAEEAWEFLKAKLLIVFEGEELRMPVEDLNKLVSVHIQRCVKQKDPSEIIEDLNDFLVTGFLSLDQTIRNVPEDRLIPYLVEMWLFVFGTVLPYVQAVFLPLDLEFRGHGPIMAPHEAAEFWGWNYVADAGPEAEMEVRKLVLLAYRDAIILPRHDALKTTFSRLSLDRIQLISGPESPAALLPQLSPRPGTASSAAGVDPFFASYNSQSSTLLSSDSGARSRATSNTSAPELPPFSPSAARSNARTPAPDSEQVTQTVGRMLQCMSVLASLRSGDEAQKRCEDLVATLKVNWLGRGRTGRQRKGFVGARVPARAGQGVRVGG